MFFFFSYVLTPNAQSPLVRLSYYPEYCKIAKAYIGRGNKYNLPRDERKYTLFCLGHALQAGHYVMNCRPKYLLQIE